MKESPIRICQFTPCLWSGGTEERIARIINNLPSDRFRITWMGFGPVREALVDKAGPSVEVFPIARHPERGIEWQSILAIQRVLSRTKPHILHLHNWSTSLYGIVAGRLAGVPRILYGSGGREVSAGANARRQKWMHTLAPHIDGYTSVCQFLGEELIEDFGASKDQLHVIKTGVDTSKIAHGATRRDIAREQLGIPKDAVVVGAISVFRPVKRIPDLIEAVGRIAQKHPDVHLLLVGNPVRMTVEDLRDQAREQGFGDRIHLPGRLEDPSKVLSAFDIFVNCSEFEGSSNAIIEAMASRLAVVGTAVGGTPELIKHEKTGLLVRPGDVDELTEAIERLVIDRELRTFLGNRASEFAEVEHDCRAMYAAYRTLYKSHFDDQNLGKWASLSNAALATLKSVRAQL
ncbi:MAG: glycosyltransferase family 4 protein [Myxococcota bacterium]|nr:glycosyltransferase family 4 protein [Myxococcota bacterium]